MTELIPDDKSKIKDSNADHKLADHTEAHNQASAKGLHEITHGQASGNASKEAKQPSPEEQAATFLQVTRIVWPLLTGHSEIKDGKAHFVLGSSDVSKGIGQAALGSASLLEGVAPQAVSSMERGLGNEAVLASTTAFLASKPFTEEWQKMFAAKNIDKTKVEAGTSAAWGFGIGGAAALIPAAWAGGIALAGAGVYGAYQVFNPAFAKRNQVLSEGIGKAWSANYYDLASPAAKIYRVIPSGKDLAHGALDTAASLPAAIVGGGTTALVKGVINGSAAGAGEAIVAKTALDAGKTATGKGITGGGEPVTTAINWDPVAAKQLDSDKLAALKAAADAAQKTAERSAQKTVKEAASKTWDNFERQKQVIGRVVNPHDHHIKPDTDALNKVASQALESKEVKAVPNRDQGTELGKLWEGIETKPAVPKVTRNVQDGQFKISKQERDPKFGPDENVAAAPKVESSKFPDETPMQGVPLPDGIMAYQGKGYIRLEDPLSKKSSFLYENGDRFEVNDKLQISKIVDAAEVPENSLVASSKMVRARELQISLKPGSEYAKIIADIPTGSNPSKIVKLFRSTEDQSPKEFSMANPGPEFEKWSQVVSQTAEKILKQIQHVNQSAYPEAVQNFVKTQAAEASTKEAGAPVKSEVASNLEKAVERQGLDQRQDAIKDVGNMAGDKIYRVPELLQKMGIQKILKSPFKLQIECNPEEAKGIKIISIPNNNVGASEISITGVDGSISSYNPAVLGDPFNLNRLIRAVQIAIEESKK